MTIDVLEYLEHFKQERYRAMIIHAAPEMGVALTEFSKKICTSVGGKYLDLLDHFIQLKELSEHIDSFNPEKFHEFLKEHSKGQTLFVIDRPDFVLDTWRREERKDIFRMINNQWDGYKTGMEARLLICLQTSSEIQSLQIADSQGQKRVFQLSDFNDIL